MIQHSLVCVLFAVSLSIAQPLTERYSQFGTVIVPEFSSAPFPHPLRAAGHTYGKKLFPAERHYSDSSVAIFVPQHFRPGKSIDLVVYFHGWYNSIDSACAQFSLIEQFSESKRNAVFVFPEGPKDSPDSFGGRMEEKDGLKNLVNDVMKELRTKKLIGNQTIGRIVLAGHSGAYRVIAFCLMRGGLTKKISDVILFDALYGETEKYAYWIDHYSGRLVNIYTDSGGTKGESENLMADLEGWGMKYYQVEESAVKTDDLKKHRLIFIHTDLTHNEVIAVRRQFRDYLMTSKLQPMH
jgi:hypothetical protein